MWRSSTASRTVSKWPLRRSICWIRAARFASRINGHAGAHLVSARDRDSAGTAGHSASGDCGGGVGGGVGGLVGVGAERAGEAGGWSVYVVEGSRDAVRRRYVLWHYSIS